MTETTAKQEGNHLPMRSFMGSSACSYKSGSLTRPARQGSPKQSIPEVGRYSKVAGAATTVMCKVPAGRAGERARKNARLAVVNGVVDHSIDQKASHQACGQT